MKTNNKNKPQGNAVPADQSISLYDALMWSIEPELTTLVLPLLPDLYAEETPEARKERFNGYAQSFEQYLEKFNTLKTGYIEYANKIKKQVMAGVQEEVKRKESGEISSLSDSIDAA